jgi:hypothetical protein
MIIVLITTAMILGFYESMNYVSAKGFSVAKAGHRV